MRPPLIAAAALSALAGWTAHAAYLRRALRAAGPAADRDPEEGQPHRLRAVIPSQGNDHQLIPDATVAAVTEGDRRPTAFPIQEDADRRIGAGLRR
jgi:hypothetical protein